MSQKYGAAKARFDLQCARRCIAPDADIVSYQELKQLHPELGFWYSKVEHFQREMAAYGAALTGIEAAGRMLGSDVDRRLQPDGRRGPHRGSDAPRSDTRSGCRKATPTSTPSATPPGPRSDPRRNWLSCGLCSDLSAVGCGSAARVGRRLAGELFGTDMVQPGRPPSWHARVVAGRAGGAGSTVRQRTGAGSPCPPGLRQRRQAP